MDGLASPWRRRDRRRLISLRRRCGPTAASDWSHRRLLKPAVLHCSTTRRKAAADKRLVDNALALTPDVDQTFVRPVLRAAYRSCPPPGGRRRLQGSRDNNTAAARRRGKMEGRCCRQCQCLRQFPVHRSHDTVPLSVRRRRPAARQQPDRPGGVVASRTGLAETCAPRRAAGVSSSRCWWAAAKGVRSAARLAS